jgi:hypothetical protein
MKTFLYSTIALILIAVNVNSQTFTFTRTSPEYVNSTDSSISCFGSVNNLTTSPLHIRLIRISNNIPAGWESSVCDIQYCYPPSTDTTQYAQYPPGENQIYVDFYTHQHSGMGTVTIKAEKQGGAENYTATFGASTFPIGIRQISSAVNEFKLNQNYPNPFNPTTRISFSIDKSNYVDLRLYDILGREVKVLLSQPMSPGEYEIDFKAENLASGMYYYRLQSGDNVAVKKMTLVK